MPAIVCAATANPGLGGVLAATRWRRLGRIALGLGVGGLLAALLLPLDAAVLRPLEERFPQPPAPARVDGILLLGGALDEFLTADRGLPSLNGFAERMTAFAALAQRYPQARLGVIGGSAAVLAESGVREADAVRDLLASLGVARERLEVEDRSRTTWENALYAKRLLQPKAGQTWLLVTSAWHMPRAVGAFRRAGWPVLPWPVGYRTLSLRHWYWSLGESLPQRLRNLDLAAHEWLGLLVYDLCGRSSALVPGP